MIDIVVQAPDLRAIRAFAIKHKLGKMVEGEFTPSKGFNAGLWNADGVFPTKNATYDDEGNELTPRAVASGIVAILRFRDDFRIRVTKTIEGEQVEVDQSDALEVDPEADNTEQHMRSRIFRFVKNNGTKGKTGTITHWKLDGVKLYRYPDVMAFIESKGLAPFVRGGGNKP